MSTYAPLSNLVGTWSCPTCRVGSKIAVSLVGRHREPTSEPSYAFALSPSHPRVGRLGRSPLVHMQPPCQCSIRLVGCPVLRSGTSGAGICTVVCFESLVSRTNVASIPKSVVYLVCVTVHTWASAVPHALTSVAVNARRQFCALCQTVLVKRPSPQVTFESIDVDRRTAKLLAVTC